MLSWKITSETSRSELLDGSNEMSSIFRQAYETWKAQCGTSPLPEWRSAKLLDYSDSLLPLAVAARYEPAGRGFRVIYWGSMRTRLQHVDCTNRLVSEYEPPVIGAKVQREHMEVRERALPLLFRSAVESPGQGRLEYYKVRLPYRDPGGEAVGIVLTFDDPELIKRRTYLAWQSDPSALTPSPSAE